MKNVFVKKLCIKSLLLLALFNVSLSFTAQKPDDGEPQQVTLAAQTEEKEQASKWDRTIQQFLPPEVAGLVGYLGYADWAFLFNHGQDIKELVLGDFNPKQPLVFATSPDGSTIALGQGVEVSVYNLQNLKRARSIKIPIPEIQQKDEEKDSEDEDEEKGEPGDFQLSAIALSDTGLLGYIVTSQTEYASDSGSIFSDTTLQAGAINIKSGQEEYSFQKKDVIDLSELALAFLPEEDSLVIGWSSFQSLTVMNVRTKEEIKDYNGLPLSGRLFGDEVYYSANGNFRSVRDWSQKKTYLGIHFLFENKRDNKWLPYGALINLPKMELFSRPVISGNGERAAAVLGDRDKQTSVVVYNILTGELIASLEGSVYFPKKSIAAIAVSNSGNQLMWIEADAMVKKFAVKVYDLDYAGMPPLEDVPDDE